MRSIAILGLALAAAPAAAQEGWSTSATLYGWFTGTTTSVELPRGTVEAEKDFSDIWADLDFALMGAVEARNGRWGLIGDFIYSDMSSSQDTPFGSLFSEVKTDMRMAIIGGYAAYRAHEDPNIAFDIVGGLRAVRIDVDVSLEPGQLDRETFGGDESWVDPVIGARMILPMGERWYGTAFVDVGGFGVGSDMTWQGLATVGYRFNDRWSAVVGYRYLSIEKPVADLDAELEFYGPVAGVTFRF